MRPTWEQEKKRLGPRCSMHAADRAERAHPLKEPGKRAARQSRGAMPERPRSARRLYRSFNGIEALADWQRSGAVENSPPESQALAGNINEPQRANNKWGRDNDYRCCDRDHLALGGPLRDERDLRQPVSKAPFYRARLPHLSWPRGHATPCSRRPRMYRRHERASFCFSRL